MINKLLLVGTGHGQLHLYNTARGKPRPAVTPADDRPCSDEPILTWSNAFRSSSSVLSCSWSNGRASVFFAHDSHGHVKYWDLTKDLYEPLGSVKIDQ